MNKAIFHPKCHYCRPAWGSKRHWQNIWKKRWLTVAGYEFKFQTRPVAKRPVLVHRIWQAHYGIKSVPTPSHPKINAGMWNIHSYQWTVCEEPYSACSCAHVTPSMTGWAANGFTWSSFFSLWVWDCGENCGITGIPFVSIWQWSLLFSPSDSNLCEVLVVESFRPQEILLLSASPGT